MFDILKINMVICVFYSFNFLQDGYAVVASDGPGVYPVIAEARAGNDGLGVTVTPGTVAYVTTGGDLLIHFSFYLFSLFLLALVIFVAYISSKCYVWYDTLLPILIFC